MKRRCAGILHKLRPVLGVPVLFATIVYPPSFLFTKTTAMMDDLSTELLSIIVAHLYAKPPPPKVLIRNRPPPVRIPYATVSRRWQEVVEAHTLASIKFKSTELGTFASVYTDPRRRTNLRRLDYSVSLPTHGDSRSNHATNLTVFGAAMKDLLELLRGWEHDVPDGDDNSIGRLEVRLQVVFDVDMSRGPAEFNFDPSRSSAGRRYLSLEGAELPIVRRITTLAVDSYGGRALHPTAMCQLAAMMPRLRKLELEYLDPVNKCMAMRKEHRMALAAGLESLNLSQLNYLHIQRQSSDETFNHSFNCADLEVDGIDPLNDALRKISQSLPLTELHLSDTLISPHLFRLSIDSGSDASTWPTLRRFTIKAGLISPSGRWYYTGNLNDVEQGSGSPATWSEDEEVVEGFDSEAGSTDSEDDPDRDAVTNGQRPSHVWRTRPDPEVFNPLVEDMADAVLRMPQLQQGHLEISLSYGDPIDVVLQCADIDQPFAESFSRQADKGGKETRRWQVWVGTATKWEIPSKVEQKWRAWLGADGKYVQSRWPPTF